jgi:protein-tyrosine phosphatase
MDDKALQRQNPKGRNDDHVFDYSKIDDFIYLGSDFCRGGKCVLHSQQFKKLGVCVEINLSAEKKEFPPDDIDIYAWIPVVDGYAPTIDQLFLGTAVMNEAIVNRNTVYVHCKNGHGRSPTLIAAYYIRYKGYSVSDAVSMIKNIRHEVHIEDYQIKALEEFNQRLKTEPNYYD